MIEWIRPFAGLVRRNPAFLIVVALHILLKILLGARMLDVPLSGDEFAYVDGAKALSNAVRDLISLSPFDGAEIRDNVVGNGWFMPGMSIVLTPLYLAVPEASTATMRLFVGVLTTGILVVVALVLHRTLGRGYALGILVFPGLVPMWILFSFTVWGDLVAGLLVVVLMVAVIGAGQRFVEGQTLRWRHGVGLGVLCSACLYVRSGMLPLILGMISLLGVAVLYFLRGPTRQAERVRSLAAVIVAAVTFASLLLPWSVIASMAYDRPVVTTTTLPLSLAITFGEEDRVCFGPCDGRNVWVGSLRYARGVSDTTGVNELVVQEQMSEYALTGVTPSHYASTVFGNLGRYLLEPASFEPRFRSPDAHSDAASVWIVESTQIAYMAALIFGTLTLVVVSTSRPKWQLISIGIKLSVAALLVQPFVHPAHGRYWPGFAPLLGIAAVYLAGLLSDRLRWPPSASELQRSDTSVSRTLTFAQVAIVAGLFLVLVALLVLSH